MTQKERIDLIADIMKKNGFVTVKYLTEVLRYSTATINRDLNTMEKQNLVKRSYGGAELAEQKVVPLFFRYSKMRPVKNKIAKKAADFVKDGDTIFIDCSTTAQYMGTYLTNKKDLTVITNNITLASYLSECGIAVICLGGRIMEPPSMIYSAETIEFARRFHADKLFFSPTSITENGQIGASKFEAHILLIKTMIENAKEIFMLCDHNKIDASTKRFLCDISAVSTAITDFTFSADIKDKYTSVHFVEIDA